LDLTNLQHEISTEISGACDIKVSAHASTPVRLSRFRHRLLARNSRATVNKFDTGDYDDDTAAGDDDSHAGAAEGNV
jgi:hypothetical protein